MGELREYLKLELPKFKDPIIFISSNFIPGCPMCNSSTSVYYITLAERDTVPDQRNVEKAQKHKFPIDIYVQYPIEKSKPKKFVIGTKIVMGKLQMVLNRIKD